MIFLTWPLKSLPCKGGEILPYKISNGYVFPGVFNKVFIWSCNNLLKLIQEQAEYFMSTWPQVFEHVFYAYAEMLVLIID